MDIDFPLVLVIAVFVTGVISLLDKVWFSKRRQQAVQELQQQGAGSELIESAQNEGAIIENAKGFFPILLLVLVLRSFLVEPFQIPSGSMEPGLVKGDFILVNKYAYGFRLPVLGTKVIEMDDPARGDIMVFIPPHDPRYFIKRVIGLPGDQIRYSNKELFVNGEKILHEPTNLPMASSSRVLELAEKDYTVQHYRGLPSKGDGEWIVPEGHYFMLGDNRDNSGDSRFWGFVPDENIVGKAFAVWMHWENWGSLPSFDRNKVLQ
ncbi:signal peptidase I [Bermanella marisrubri]|uniref:Signal peptidase I n=1 Tax=Bermanella marisrubri TaxID=207949 RepID=Q1N0R7_9GAMM|nr:signal peptidase I [Bermanella marisrubri]EAT11766.1 signal peptidase I [Oceanobacter sp. RED65] [Bermanella marisrubri]QIZ83801.1 signal peptidase I [Bermanella marisrubri]